MVGIDPASDGLARAPRARAEDHRRGRRRAAAARRSATASASPSTRPRRTRTRATRASCGARRASSIDLTPAAIGPYCVPPVNLDEHVGAGETNVNMVTCGGQATDPDGGRGQPRAAGRVRARSSPPSPRGRPARARARTSTSSRAPPPAPSRSVGGAERGKAIIVLNPAEPPLIMRDTVHCLTDDDARPGDASPPRSHAMVARGAAVRARLPAQERARCSTAGASPVFLEVEGRRLPAQVRRQPRHHDRRPRCAPAEMFAEEMRRHERARHEPTRQEASRCTT